MKHTAIVRFQRVLSLLLPIIFVVTSLGGCSKDRSFAEYTRSIFLDEITSNTLNLHYCIENPQAYGIKNYNISLGDFSKNARNASSLALLDTKADLLNYHYLSLTTEEKLTYDILNDYLDTQIKLCNFQLYEEPLSFSGGIQAQLPILLAEYEFNTEQDVKDYLELISFVDDFFIQIVDFEKEKSAAGLFMSDELCQAVIDSCQSFIENPKEHYLLTTFENRLTKLNLSERKTATYIKGNQKIFTDAIIPAYEYMIKELTSLLGTGHNNGGLCNFEYGKDYYELLVYSETGCDDSIDEIFNRIHAQRLNDLIVCADLQSKDPTIIEKCTYLEWEMEDTETMLSHLQNEILKTFPTPPDTNYEVHYIDDSLEAYLAPAFYIVAPIDNYRENEIYINDAYMSNDIYCFTTLAHEGYPGHLYQTVMTYEYGFPEVRSILDFPGYVEGWATYVEMMSYDYAGLDEDVSSMLAYNQSATLSLYASSDIGLHYYGWTKEDMYSFWASYGITDTDTIDEITQLILAEPGNYLKYYVGYIEFLDLKNYAKELLGSDFDLVTFHRTILDLGPAPFPILEKYFKTYYYSPQTESTTD